MYRLLRPAAAMRLCRRPMRPSILRQLLGSNEGICWAGNVLQIQDLPNHAGLLVAAAERAEGRSCDAEMISYFFVFISKRGNKAADAGTCSLHMNGHE
jgi:hypothetical protein